jgi:protoporphyrinogen oxidase
MKTKKHIVVGGGIAGIVTAYYLMRGGHSVILLESAATVGGLLASKKVNGRYYDHGTHILAETGISELDAFLFDGIACDYFQHAKVGSYIGALYQRNGFINDFSFLRGLRQEMMDAYLSHPRGAASSPDNLRVQLIRDYGVLVYEKLLEPSLRKFFHSDPRDLMPNSQGLFGMSRIMLGDEESSRALKTDPIHDRLLGYHSYTEGSAKHRSLYPREGGVGAWIHLLESKLRQGGVEIITKAEFSIDSANDQIQQLVVNGVTYEVDRLYWTVPAALIYDKLKMKKLVGGPPRRLTSVVVDVEVEGNYATDVFYVQNYDPSMQSFRVTLYDNYNARANDSTRRATVEFLVEGNGGAESFYGAQAILELKQMSLIEAGAVTRVAGCEFIRGGFPVPTADFAASTKSYAEGLAGISNLLLFGKATGRTWFMADVIREIHQHFVNENNI